MKWLGAAIRDCKQLRCIVVDGKDSLCDLLKQVPNPSRCSLKLGSYDVGDVCLTSAGAGKLSSLLPRFNNFSHLNLSFDDVEVYGLITSITHKSVKELTLSRMILTPAAASRGVRSVTSLEILVLEATWNHGSLQTVHMEALFGRFNKTLPLYCLSLSGYLAPLTKSFRFFFLICIFCTLKISIWMS